jgi:PAS domain S-box-containing protein
MMHPRHKLLVRVVLSVTAVILISSVITGTVIVKTWQSSTAVITAAGIAFSFFVSFAVFLSSYKVWIRPLAGSLVFNTHKNFEDFMEDLPLGVFIKDENSRAVYLNKYMDKVFCKPNCIGKTPYNIFDKDIATRVLNEDKRVLSGESFMVEEVIADKNGRDRIYMTHKFPLYYGGPNHFIGGISIEITHRREAEYRLRILSKAIKNSPVCVLITDPAGHIEYVNPAFVNSTGYSFAEVMGEKMSIINSGHHPEPFFREMWDTINGGGDWQGEILNRKKDGTRFWEFVSISPVKNNDDEITHFIAIKDDISKRKLVEETQKKAKEKAEENDRLKSAFLANMSHEIRTPLNAIVGLSAMLSETGLTSGEKENYSAIIKENSDILLQLIDDIIDVSKIEAGQIIMHPEPCNINNLLSDIYETFQLQLRGNDKLKLFLDDPGKSELFTLVDAHRFRQVVTNLLSNAIKFTEKGLVRFGYSISSGGQILFHVRDTGIGIPRDKHNKIFDRFGQVDDSKTSRYRGAGLGLAISKSLVNLMGGTIWVDSEPGKGSGFFFTIPYIPVSGLDEVPARQPDTAVWPDLKEKTILIVEDREVNYRLIGKMLRKSGASILWAKTGLQAIEIHRERRDIDLVLLDINLSDIEGYEVLQEIRKTSRSLPVIIQTARAMKSERERCQSAGCNGYITKPIQTGQLLAAIRKCMLL